jgi:hypothetical protein
MQLVDELSMIYTTVFMVFATFAYARSTMFQVVFGIGLTWLAWFITVRSLPEASGSESLLKRNLGKILPHQGPPIPPGRVRSSHCSCRFVEQ